MSSMCGAQWPWGGKAWLGQSMDGRDADAWNGRGGEEMYHYRCPSAVLMAESLLLHLRSRIAQWAHIDLR